MHRIPIRAISLAIVLAVALYIGMVLWADWRAFSRAVSALPPMLWAEVLALSMTSYLLRFARWQRFLRALGHSIAIPTNLRIYLSGFALTLTPGKAGETIRSLYLRVHGVRYAESIGAFIAERLLDLLAVAAIACLAVLAFPAYRLWVAAAAASCATMVWLFRSRLLAMLAARLGTRALGRHAADALDTVRSLLVGAPLRGALPLSFLAWSAQGMSLHLIVDALGYELGAASVMAIYCLSILAGAASFIPGGLGATEASIALLLGAAGMSHSDAVSASLVSRGLTLWPAVAIGLAAISRAALHGQACETPVRAPLLPHANRPGPPGHGT